MTPDDFKKLLDEALEPLKQKLDDHDEKFNNMDERFNNMDEKFNNISEKLDSHSAALVSIEGKLDAYGDMYKINDSNIRKVEKRLEVLEKNADITPPPELILTDVS